MEKIFALSIDHVTQSEEDERDLKKAIVGLFKINGKSAIEFPSMYARPQHKEGW